MKVLIQQFQVVRVGSGGAREFSVIFMKPL